MIAVGGADWVHAAQSDRDPGSFAAAGRGEAAPLPGDRRLLRPSWRAKRVRLSPPKPMTRPLERFRPDWKRQSALARLIHRVPYTPNTGRLPSVGAARRLPTRFSQAATTEVVDRGAAPVMTGLQCRWVIVSARWNECGGRPLDGSGFRLCRVGTALGHRQPDPDRGPLPRIALEHQPATMTVHDMLHDRQPQAGAARIA